MKKYVKSQNRFLLSEKHPSEYPIKSNEDVICVDIASALGESDMRFILARRHQLGIGAIEDTYAVVKDEMRKGKCENPRRLFNFLLTQKLKEKKKINN
ncbi:MAG TPA: hypothetical protein VJG67_03865 [Candidatus Paceibacterota bacterium]